MVLISFKKLTFLLKAIEDCPEGIPFRQSKIIRQFLKLPTTYDEKVSVKIPLEWEKFPESDISLHDDQEKILCHIITTFTGKLTDQVPELHITSPLQRCPICRGDLDFAKRIKYRKDPSAMVYCKDGPRIATVYPKKCTNCSATIFSSYVEYEQEDGIVMRKYFENSEYISATQDTFFECALLEELSEDIFTCNTRFINWSEKYNRLHIDSLKKNVLSTTNLKNKRYELNRQRVLPCWILYSMNKKLDLLFPVQRDESRSLDIELICKIMYPELKKKINSKWLGHICQQCSSRVVIMDGAAKMYRTRCAAKGECIKNAGHLNEFTSCAASPIQGSNFCEEHKNGKVGDTIERLDLGRITRSKRKELGLEIDLLTTETACRKPSAITVTKDRSKTAGMVYCFRSCGVSLGHLECIHAETNTGKHSKYCDFILFHFILDFILLLIDIFGERPSPDQLTGKSQD